jgi:hypothetical protein
MKKFGLLLGLIILSVCAYAQPSGPTNTFIQSIGPVSSLIACTASAGVNTSASISPCGGQGGMFQNSLVSVQTINWTVVATVSTCTLELEQSTTGTGSWTLLGVQQTCTSSGSYTVTASAPYVRFNINSLTTTGSGSLTVNYFGQVATSLPQSPLTYVANCGTTTTCTPVLNVGTFKVTYGTCTAAAATTCTVTALPYTSIASYNCFASDATTAANAALKLTNASASSFVITTTSSSDAFSWACFGT